MGIQLAVPPGTKSPGIYIKVDLTAGASAPGGARLRALVIAPKSAAGKIVPDTQLREAVAGVDDAKTIWGPGTQGHLACVRIFKRYPLASIDAVAPEASIGNTAVGSFVLSGSPTAPSTIRIHIKGVRIDVPWNVGESPDQGRDRCLLVINAATESIPCIAASTPNAGEAALNAKVAGPWGNDIQLSVELLGEGGNVQVTAFTGGSVEPDFTDVLSLVSAREYDIIVACVSNADAEDSSGNSNVSKAKQHMLQHASGLNAKLQTCIVGLSSALPSSAKAGAIKINDGPVQYVFCMNGQELGCELAGFEAADRLHREELELSNPNRIGTVYEGFVGAADKVTDGPTDPEVEDALNNGLSILNYTAQGDLYLVAPITTHSQDASGNPDSRIYYVTEVTATYAVAKDLRRSIPQEFFQTKVIKDQPPGSEPLPDKTVEERDVKAFVITRLRFFQRRGVVRRDALDEAIAKGTLVVQVNDSDASQVDVLIPLAVVKPAAKFGVVVEKQP